jgi:2-phosphoglycerate kinase
VTPIFREIVENRPMIKPVIFIGGTAGTGKSTLAGELCARWSLDHRLGTGFIREIVKSQHRKEDCGELHSFTFRAEKPVDNLRAQSMWLHSAIVACVERARREGTSLVIEGNHLLPDLYGEVTADLFVILAAPEREEHLRRLHGPSHLNRKTSESDFDNVRRIDDYLRGEARRCGIPYLPYGDDVAEFIERLPSTRQLKDSASN